MRRIKASPAAAAAVLGVSALILAGCAGRSPGAVARSATPTPGPLSSTRLIHHTGAAPAVSKEELQDLRTSAKQTHKRLKDLLQQQVGQAQVDELAAGLEADPTSGVVSVWRVSSLPPLLHMTFTHPPSAAVLAELRALPLDTQVTSGLPLGHVDLVAFSQTAFGSLEHVPGIQLISGGPNTAGDAIEIEYALTPGTAEPPTTAQLLGRIRAATGRWATDGRLPMAVHLHVRPLSNMETPSTSG